MPVLTVEGTYKEGKVKLSETSPGVREAHVLVAFLSATGDAVQAPLAAAQGMSRQEAARRMFERMDRGIDFGGERSDRAEIYEERLRQMDERRVTVLASRRQPAAMASGER